MRKYLFTYTWFFLLVLVMPTYPAHAYLDAGTGSYAIQVVIGVIFGSTYALKSFGGNMMTAVKSRFRKTNQSAHQMKIEEDTQADEE